MGLPNRMRRVCVLDGIAGAILGRSLYEGRIVPAEALALAAA